MNDEASIKAVIKGSSVVFGVTNCECNCLRCAELTTFAVWEEMDADLETKQGKTIVDACKEANVDRLIFSTLLGITECI